MIPDTLTNTVFFSEDTLEEYPEETEQLSNIIQSAGYSVKFLEGTEDFFCRDFMPVQVRKDDFMQFIYRPEVYLTKKELQYISNPVLVALTNELPAPRYSPLILDGGNLIRWNDKVIVSDRIFQENARQFDSKKAILQELEKNLQCQAIIIPEYPNEPTGHADGLIRFIDDNRVFINERTDEPEQDWLEDFLAVLEKNHLVYTELPCAMEEVQEDAIGLYINYLQVGKLIVMPQFDGFLGDNEKALEIARNNFPADYKIIPFPADWIAKLGGVFNCMSWTVKL